MPPVFQSFSRLEYLQKNYPGTDRPLLCRSFKELQHTSQAAVIILVSNLETTFLNITQHVKTSTIKQNNMIDEN